jgi:hypothetical protein
VSDEELKPAYVEGMNASKLAKRVGTETEYMIEVGL